MRLFRAELRKLNRPLLWAAAVVNASFCLLLAWIGAYNAHLDASSGHSAGTLYAARELQPAASGAIAAGLMASLPGALIIALIAGGHFGGEWSGKTVKSLLLQHGRRTPVVLTKLVSLWCAGVAVMLIGWAALAAAAPLLHALYDLPPTGVPWPNSLTFGASQVARATLVIAAFAVLGGLSATLTRNTVGTIALSSGVVVASLIGSSWAAVATALPTTWVQAWMGFQPGDRARIPVTSHFWSRFAYAGGSAPSHLLGAVGLTASMLVAAAFAVTLFRRADVTG